MNMKCIIILLSFIVFVNSSQPCIQRDYGYGSTVCVCNLTHCDDLDALKITTKGVVTVFETSKSGDRLEKTELKFGDNSEFNANKSQTITVDKSKGVYQKIVGFGGAFTDAAGLNIKTLPEKLQNRIISDYFSKSGIEYNLGRIPIGGSDFSTHAYSYDDNNKDDFDLKHFSLAKEDLDYKIPVIKKAKQINSDLRVFGSPWSPPAWMKNNSELNHGGYLIGEPGGKYYKAYANYIVKFLDSYKASGVPIWGITVDNEPNAALLEPDFSWNSLSFTPELERDFIKKDLGPTLEAAGYEGRNSLSFTPELERDFIKKDLGPTLEAAGYGVNTTQLMICDDQRDWVHTWANTIYTDKDAAKYVSGLAFHWYTNILNPENAQNLDVVHNTDPSKFILATEACEMYFGKEQHVYLGSWQTFDRYAKDIIIDLNHWTSGWVDWNMALDTEGGPNWAKNFVDAPVIVNATSQEYYKNPIFYAMGHYSKFLTPGSQRVFQTQEPSVDTLLSTTFVRPDGGTVVIALNLGDEPIDITIDDLESKQKVT
ncbi:unnamed protein product, partial [Oppiella nova]